MIRCFYRVSPLLLQSCQRWQKVLHVEEQNDFRKKKLHQSSNYRILFLSSAVRMLDFYKCVNVNIFYL